MIPHEEAQGPHRTGQFRIHTIVVPRPPNLQLELRPPAINTGSTAVGRCGDRIFTRHLLGIVGTELSVFDTAASREFMRNKEGARPLGPLGMLTGHSIHRCDVCRRKEDLLNTIICPTCAMSIPAGDPINLIPSGAVLTTYEWVPNLTRFTTVLNGGADAIVCEHCSERHFPDVRNLGHYEWTGRGVLCFERRAAA